MLYQNVRVMAHSLRFIDAAAVGLATVLTFQAGVLAGAWPLQPLTYPVILFAVTTALAFIALAERLHVYHGRRTEYLASELVALAETALYSSSIGCILSVTFRPDIPPRLYFTALAAGIGALVALRLAMRVVIRRLRRRGNDYRACLIVGDNARTARLLETISANPHFGIVIEGIVDIEPGSIAGGNSPRTSRISANGVRRYLLPDIEALRPIVGNNVIDEVFVTLPVRSCYDQIQRILDICGDAGISVKLPPQAFERAGSMTEVSQIGQIPMLTHFSGPSDYLQLVAKRMIDAVGAAAGLVLLSPVFIVLAIAIKLSSPGPVFFIQRRVGLHGRLFPLVKFRSMFQDASQHQAELDRLSETGGIAFKIKQDPRITRPGRVMRKFHLDELPQLWSVLIGDMSLVGPRPLPPEEARRKEWWQRRRLSMPPGLTCSWQVAADHHMPFSRWMQLDLDYIDGWSVWLDLKIIASTFGTVAKGKGW